MVFEVRAETGQKGGAIQRVTGQLGIGVESLRLWVTQAEVGGGHRPGTTTADAARIRELEQQVRELRRANEILRSAAVFFAGELDPRVAEEVARAPRPRRPSYPKGWECPLPASGAQVERLGQTSIVSKGTP